MRKRHKNKAIKKFCEGRPLTDRERAYVASRVPLWIKEIRTGAIRPILQRAGGEARAQQVVSNLESEREGAQNDN